MSLDGIQNKVRTLIKLNLVTPTPINLRLLAEVKVWPEKFNSIG
jgi:hypothetical protein